MEPAFCISHAHHDDDENDEGVQTQCAKGRLANTLEHDHEEQQDRNGRDEEDEILRHGRLSHFLANGFPPVVMSLVGLENILLLLRRCRSNKLQESVDFPKLGHADVHVVVQNGLESCLGLGVFSHVGENRGHLNHGSDFARGDFPAVLPPVQRIVKHTEVVGHEATTSHPHVHA